jgi:hypothetical protein
MKKIIFLMLLAMSCSVVGAQQVTLTFDNAEITTDGVDDFYEVDVFINSDQDFSLGDGNFYFDYNPLAFGNTIGLQGSNVVEYTAPINSIMGGESSVFGGAFQIPNYGIGNINDNTPTRVVIAWQQLVGGNTIGNNIGANTPLLFVHVRVKMMDSSQPSGFCFTTDATTGGVPPNDTLDENFFTACGGTFPGQIDCSSGNIQLPDFIGDCSNAEVPVGYVWDAGAWNIDPVSTPPTFLDDLIIRDTGAVLGSNTINNLTIESGGSLDLISSTLIVFGNMTVDGSFVSPTGTVILGGTTPQTLSGNATVGSLEIANTGTMESTLIGSLSVNQLLTLTSGDLNVMGGTLTINSDALGTAYVASYTGGSIIGDVTVERSIAAHRTFRFLASSLDTSGSINANWQEGAATAMSNPVPGFGTHITGSSTGANGFDQSGGSASMFGYDNVSQAWTAVTNTDVNLLDAGTAYRLFVRGSRSVDLSSNASPADATVLRATGTLRTSDVLDTFVTDANQLGAEFMFTGNPYAAPVDMIAVGNNALAGTQNINTNFLFVWDSSKGANGAYVTVDLVGGGTNTSMSTANQFLQPGQAVFMGILSSAAGLTTGITYTQDDIDITASSNTQIFARNTANNRIVAQLFNSSLPMANSLVDSFKIDFAATNSNTVNSFDAPKFNNLDETMAVINGVNRLAIERRGLPVNGEQIVLDMTNYRATDYVLSLDTSEYDSSTVTAVLQDNFLNTSIPLVNGVNNINVYINSADASAAADRFSIVFENTVLSSDDVLNNGFTIFPNPVSNGVVTINAPSFVGQKVAVSVSSILGQQVYAMSTDFDSATLQLDTFTTLPVGMYIVTLSSGDHSISRKIVKK